MQLARDTLLKTIPDDMRQQLLEGSTTSPTELPACFEQLRAAVDAACATIDERTNQDAREVGELRKEAQAQASLSAALRERAGQLRAEIEHAKHELGKTKRDLLVAQRVSRHP